MNGTTGTIMKTAQTSFRNPLRSLRPARLIQASTTASGCRKQTRSSRSFFMTGRSPGSGGGNPQHVSGSACLQRLIRGEELAETCLCVTTALAREVGGEILDVNLHPGSIGGDVL